MLHFLLCHNNLPYLACLVVVGFLAVIEIMARIAGGSFIPLFDTPQDQELKQVSNKPSVSRWLCINRMSVLLWFAMGLSLFSLLGFTINGIVIGYSGDTLPQSISLWLVFPLTGFGCHWLGQWDGWQNVAQRPSDEELDFSGSVAVLTLGKAGQGMPAEALVRDRDNHHHYILVEPLEGEPELLPGTSVVLLSRHKTIWQAMRFEP